MARRGHQTRPAGGAQSIAQRICTGSRAARQVRTRGASAGELEPPEYRPLVRARDGEQRAGSRDGCPTRQPGISRDGCGARVPRASRGFRISAEHRFKPQAPGPKPHHLPGDGAGGRPDPGGAHPAGTDADRRGGPHRETDRRGGRVGAREGRRPPRSETGERQHHARRHREGAGLRSGQGAGRGPDVRRRPEPGSVAVADPDPGDDRSRVCCWAPRAT